MTSISIKLIILLSKRFRKSQKRKYDFSKGALNSDQFNIDYALHKQYLFRVQNGYPYDFFGKKVLEIGCGHGGVSVFLVVNGAREVVGIDLNHHHLEIADKFKKFMEKRFGETTQLPVAFLEMSAFSLRFDSASFDMVIADNVFEHFDMPERVLSEAFRVLKPGGHIVVPSFNAVKSKFGAHVKYGLGIPWVNVLFSEKSICMALETLAKKEPDLYEAYPGLKSNARTLAELRAYRDLNGMTHSRFVRLAKQTGFQLSRFSVFPPFSRINVIFRILYKIEAIRYSWFADIFSKGASAVLQKPQQK